ncbi:unnamed protein product [Prorocentrum cordatum]|uniref:Uncharacterized protein n=1 Tax=Prorocentrum cordatum TaxID=2364126 RepID=A0ABN9V128_9DINO|nr:unnamed protein product [Polarella glacialis]
MFSACARPIQPVALRSGGLYAPGHVATYVAVQLGPEIEGPPRRQRISTSPSSRAAAGGRVAPMLSPIQPIFEGARAWVFICLQLAASMQKVSRVLDFNLVTYQACRSGAGTDVAAGQRALAGLKRRGGWGAALT